MILNFTAKDGVPSLLLPSNNSLEVVNYAIMARAESKVRSIIKAKTISIKLQLILLKTSYTGDLCHSNRNSPSKMSLFFMNILPESNNDTDLKLHLKSVDGKGLSDECINSLL